MHVTAFPASQGYVAALVQRKQQEAIRQRNLRREADLEARRTNGEGAEGNEEG